ncbi:CotH protein [Lachnospiraceae bacterium G11]|nr:CotH protein [Lachnospiraceae bacterium G11]
MVSSKHISKIIIVLTALTVIACLLAVVFQDKVEAMVGGSGVTMEYETKLFDTDEVMQVNISIDEDDWEDMLSNALSEEYYTCDVEINGLTVKNVAIRPKGNTSLTNIANDPDTDRYSLKLEFDHYVEGQTCYGLDKLILNNNYADATNMKEAIVYDMYQFLGADASLYNYAEVYVNGEYWGVYLALEGVEQSFMLRNYGTQDGELYKPENMDMSEKGGERTEGIAERPDGAPEMSEGMPEMPEGFDPENMPEMPEQGEFDPGAMKERANMGEKSEGMRGMRDNGGSDLNYVDDELDSYSTIWDGAITESGDKDHKRVVKALKNISEGNDLEKYMDVDNILKYMAVHTFAVNLDSLSGNMAHNYYLYEYDGQLNVIPWDYNLSWGGMGGGDSDATEMINYAIDSPFSSTEFFDGLLSNPEYLEKYHEYLRQLVDEYINGGRFDEVYERITSQIDSLVETDPTAFYTYEEYQSAAEMLYDVIKLRAKSIAGQLDGTIPSTDEGQKEDSSSLIDASEIDTSVMGHMNGGGGGRDAGAGRGEFGDQGESRPKFGERPDSSDDGSGDDQREFSENGAPEPPSGDFQPGEAPGEAPEPPSGNFQPGEAPEPPSGNFQPGDAPELPQELPTT